MTDLLAAAGGCVISLCDGRSGIGNRSQESFALLYYERRGDIAII